MWNQEKFDRDWKEFDKEFKRDTKHLNRKMKESQDRFNRGFNQTSFMNGYDTRGSETRGSDTRGSYSTINFTSASPPEGINFYLFPCSIRPFQRGEHLWI